MRPPERAQQARCGERTRFAQVEGTGTARDYLEKEPDAELEGASGLAVAPTGANPPDACAQAVARTE